MKLLKAAIYNDYTGELKDLLILNKGILISAGKRGLVYLVENNNQRFALKLSIDYDSFEVERKTWNEVMSALAAKSKDPRHEKIYSALACASNHNGMISRIKEDVEENEEDLAQVGALPENPDREGIEGMEWPATILLLPYIKAEKRNVTTKEKQEINNKLNEIGFEQRDETDGNYLVLAIDEDKDDILIIPIDMDSVQKKAENLDSFLNITQKIEENPSYAIPKVRLKSVEETGKPDSFLKIAREIGENPSYAIPTKVRLKNVEEAEKPDSFLKIAREIGENPSCAIPTKMNLKQESLKKDKEALSFRKTLEQVFINRGKAKDKKIEKFKTEGGSKTWDAYSSQKAVKQYLPQQKGNAEAMQQQNSVLVTSTISSPK